MASFLFWHMRGERAELASHTAMVAPGRRALWSLCVCFTALHTNSLRVTMRESTVEVVRGDFVILPCSFFTSSPLSRLNIIWTLAPLSSPESPIQVIVYDHGQIIEDPSLIGRVGFTGIPWSADIMVNDTRVSDAGIYRCMVNNPPETADPGIGELLLTVLVAPSLPACQWDGDMDAGGSVTLSCSVVEGVPTPEIRWDKLNPEEISLPINMEDVRPISLLRLQPPGNGELLHQPLHLQRSGREFLRDPAGSAAYSIHEPDAVNPAGAHDMASSDRPGRTTAGL
ncbi:immunoglobulin superfamily member 11 isoform X2 [Phyllopteryx taeniolatus]|uniref:immunoglobulin superfamily member 11 isoform X2 n=1 Tax=Phyllopteryx taeniolatus TaxID=161469 RepID=UPI002AD2DC7A|nr:immunoglobulin superfamily member 11 isoform X2 [Phyllopteryx taeniolatus]